jgi:hypothetical protein
VGVAILSTSSEAALALHRARKKGTTRKVRMRINQTAPTPPLPRAARKGGRLSPSLACGGRSGWGQTRPGAPLMLDRGDTCLKHFYWRGSPRYAGWDLPYA